MPWIFLTLMLANIVYFGWSFISASQAPVRVLSAPVQQEGKPIMLLAERKQSSMPDQELAPAAEPEIVAPPIMEAPAVQCFYVGPFTVPASAQALSASMSGKGFYVRIEQRKAEGRDYWIYVPPFTNRAKAEERLSELRSKGIESFIVGEGPFVNAISLGHFSKKELAESFRDKLAAAGVVAEYREMANEGRVSWIYAAPGRAKRDLRAAVEGELLRDPLLRKEVAACEE